MMGFFSKDLFLPSLLDRLVNEDHVNQLMNEIKHKIKQVEQEMNLLLNMQGGLEIREKHNQLQRQLAGLYIQYNTLHDSITSKQDIQACVRRDLEWLFNANQYFPPEELSDLSETIRSVINYGIPDLTGKTITSLDLVQIERALMQAIIDFEPRIIQKTLSVKVLDNQENRERNMLVFEIDGEIQAKPLPFRLRLRTEFELDSKHIALYDLNEK